MFKLDSSSFLLVDDVTARHYLTEMDPEYVQEDKTKDSRTKYTEIVNPFDCLVPGIDLLLRVLWSATKRGQEERSHRGNKRTMFHPCGFIVKDLESWLGYDNISLAMPEVEKVQRKIVAI